MTERAQPSADPEQVRPEQVSTDLTAFVQQHWAADMSLRDWREQLLQAGWAVPSWPQRWHGRGLPAWADELVASELIRLGTVGIPVGSGTWLAAPTILAHGTDELRDRLLGPILTGEQTWCQLFSEPGAGSDLAGLSTSAVLDGDSWVINGQKVWNTSAHHADMGMLLARTDASVPKHQGITYFALPMHQSGVEVRQLRQMNFHASFNEVFLTDARVPRDNVIGAVGAGWAAALTTLAYERRFSALRRPDYSPASGRALDEARAEADDHFATYSWYPQRAGRPDLVVEHAKAAGVTADPVIRQAIARLITMHRASAWTAERARAARAAGARPGAEGSIGKLAASNIARESAKVHSMIAAAGALLTGPDSPLRGIVAEVLMSVPGQSIAGGTDEIQKNILAEKVLGLPAEIRVDRDVPFSQLKHRG
ncbi:MAG TPA: acyl-CoA dehydrogenase family protein [Streptosporangiaceae bacterium]|nr:acyl-CoA dehydrogenase family protein [Streptosporangiaceae bacterium]